VAGLQPTSGVGYRLVLLAVFLPIGIHHVWKYARGVGEDPSRSLVAGVAPPEGAGGVVHGVHAGAGGALATGSSDEATAAESDGLYPAMTATHRWVLGVVALFLVVLIVGLSRWGWYLVEMGALFVAMALVLAVLARISPDRTAVEFGKGAAELTTTALMIGVARAIQVVLDEGGVVDTIVHGISVPLQELPGALSAVGMFVVQSLANFFIPSGSGQAYVTMPIMAPLADLVGVSRQVAVLAYQFGDGFSNMVIPTNAVLMGILGIAGIPYDRWLRFVLPLMGKLLAAAAVTLVGAVMLGYR
jgi:uncharacterized ion transporter superfamily protein YfcC